MCTSPTRWNLQPIWLVTFGWIAEQRWCKFIWIFSLKLWHTGEHFSWACLRRHLRVEARVTPPSRYDMQHFRLLGTYILLHNFDVWFEVHRQKHSWSSSRALSCNMPPQQAVLFSTILSYGKSVCFPFWYCNLPSAPFVCKRTPLRSKDPGRYWNADGWPRLTLLLISGCTLAWVRSNERI